MSDEVSERLIAKLEAEAKLVDRGEFTMDDVAARTKLAQYRLAEPSDWICLVVEAANLFGATRVGVVGKLAQMWIRFDGEPLDGAAIFSKAAASEDTDEPYSRLGLRNLAIAIWTLFGHYEVSAVEIESPRGRVRLHADGRTERWPGKEQTNLVRVFGLRDSERERERLRERCRHSPMAIAVERERISFGMRRWLVEREARGIMPIIDGERTIGYVGGKPDSSRATIQLMTHGVAAEVVSASTWEGLAILDVPLAKDLGERAVLRDAEFDRVMALVEAAASRVALDAPPEPIRAITPRPEQASPSEYLLVTAFLVMIFFVAMIALAF